MVTIITVSLRWLRTLLHAEKEEGNEDCKGKQENKPLCNGNNLRFPKKQYKTNTAITKGKTPVPVCSPKLSPVGRGSYLDG